MREKEGNCVDKIVVRLIEERDVKGVIEVLSHEEFYRNNDRFPHDFKKGLMRKVEEVKEKGFDKYSNHLVAATKDRAVARLVMDTNYEPYAELAGLIVHPNYRGRGIGTQIISEFLDLSQQHGCKVVYVTAKKKEKRLHRFYTKLGFKPAILSSFDKDEEEIVLFQFLEGTSQNEFVSKHPLSGFSTLESTIVFHDQPLYEMKWRDPLTSSYIAYYLKGKRHLSMPRIVGITLKEDNVAFDVWVIEETTEIDFEHEGRFKICITNRSNNPLSAKIDYILPEGTTLKDIDLSEEIMFKRMSTTDRELCLKLEPGFNVPQLSFPTILATCKIKIEGLTSPLHVSVGFEKNK